MQFFEVSPSELKLIVELRTLKPFEQLNIVADRNGKPGEYYVTATRKCLLTDKSEMQYLK